MSWPLSLALLGWSAWTPGAATVNEWHALLDAPAAPAPTDTAPRTDFVPPMLRRRLSSLDRAALAVAVDCLGAESRPLRSIFASPNGEAVRTIELLQQLAASEALSPIAFSLSVHNAGAGLYALATANRAASTSLAAGDDTLAMAFVEAAAQLARDTEPLLLVYVDEPLPDFYRPWQPQPPRPFALALLLAPADDDHRRLRLQRGAAESTALADPTALPALLLQRSTGAVQRGERASWHWSVA